MNKPVIQVENLSKAYRIGLKEEVPDTLTQAALGWARAPWKNFQRLRNLNTFKQANPTSEDEKNPHSALRTPHSDILWALRDVSFNVHEGEVVGIIGRNGAGKSTLLKILSRITEPTHGRAIIRGRVSSLLEVGTGFHPELTGRENIYMNGTILGMTKREIDRKFDEIVDFSGVEKFLDTPIKRYSSGMSVRLAFAVAAHLEPEILIIDEVLAVGDAEFQKKCLGKMRDVAAGGRTVLFVSHNMAAVENLCTSGLLLGSGEVALYDGTDEVVTLYGSWTKGNAKAGEFSSTDFIRAVRVVDEDGRTTSQVNPRTSLQFEIDIELPDCAHEPVVGIGISTLLGICICTLSTAFQKVPLSRASGLTTFRCTVGNLPLSPGWYELRLGYDDEKGRSERVESAAAFEVLSRSLGGRKTPTTAHGILTPDAKWSLA